MKASYTGLINNKFIIAVEFHLIWNSIILLAYSWAIIAACKHG